MTELDVLKHAKNYLDQMSRGTNPLDGKPIDAGDLILQPRISRCLAYVSGVLEKLIENGGVIQAARPELPPFTITQEQLRDVRITDEPVGIRDFCDRINACVDTNAMRRLNPTYVTGYLVRIGLLQDIILQDGKKRRSVTQDGADHDIRTVYKSSVYKDRPSIVYGPGAQRFLLDHMDAILAWIREQAARKNTPDDSTGT